MSTVPPIPRKFVRLAHLRRLRGCEQVAAVCYRVRNGEIQFLLVETRGSGRWTFPKGSAERGLTHAQAAALEAYEEAGVHGRIEEVAFTRYTRKTMKTQTVSVHLCEVTRQEAPPEAGRNPTWFSAEKTKRCLGENRSSGHAAELARVMERAVARIQRLRAETALEASPRANEGLQKVQFIDCAWRPVDMQKALPGKPRRQFLN